MAIGDNCRRNTDCDNSSGNPEVCVDGTCQSANNTDNKGITSNPSTTTTTTGTCPRKDVFIQCLTQSNGRRVGVFADGIQYEDGLCRTYERADAGRCPELTGPALQSLILTPKTPEDGDFVITQGNNTAKTYVLRRGNYQGPVNITVTQLESAGITSPQQSVTLPATVNDLQEFNITFQVSRTSPANPNGSTITISASADAETGPISAQTTTKIKVELAAGENRYITTLIAVPVSGSVAGFVSGRTVANTTPQTQPASTVQLTALIDEKTSFSAQENDGYRFVGWFLNNTLWSTTRNQEISSNKNQTYEARFALIDAPVDCRCYLVEPTVAGQTFEVTYRKCKGETVTETFTKSGNICSANIPQAGRNAKVPQNLQTDCSTNPAICSPPTSPPPTGGGGPSTTSVKGKIIVNISVPSINLTEKIISASFDFLNQTFDTYINEDRELKTLLNYGEDRQSVILAARRGPLDENGIDTLQLKLLQPVPTDVSVNTPVFLSREVAKTIIDKVRTRFAPELDKTPYLRPKNTSVKVNLDTGKSVKNLTLNKLSLNSGSVGLTDQYLNKNFEDEIFRQWYSYDFNSADLNIDFTNYSNFVFYSSAAMRLASFRQKLQEIERLDVLRKQFATTYASTSSVAISLLQDKSAEYSVQKENIIRSFDRYEQHLYFTSGTLSPYTASFDYVDGGVEFNSSSYWPKSGSSLWPVYSEVATEWYNTQLAIAQRFDEFNENNLVNTIPTYVREDDDSASYITFVSMIGQLFDNIKIYIDQFPNIYSRNLDPNEELAKDLIAEIAESIGFKLPTIDSVYNLTDNILGVEGSTPRRDLAAEIYKRLLHNLPFFAKAKGTKTALDTLLKTFGITPQLISVKETGTPTSSSYYVFDEYTTGLDFDETKQSYITLPLSASNRTPITLQLNCSIAKSSEMTIITGDDKWALNVAPHPSISKLGRFEILSGSNATKIVTSSYYPIFGNELLNITIKNYLNTSSFYFTQVDGEDTVFSQIVTNNEQFSNLWNASQNIYLGGDGPRVTARFAGTLDEVRLWGIPLSDEVIFNTVFDPGSTAGDSYSDSANYLYVQLSFNNVNKPQLIASNSIDNESAYKNINDSPSLKTLSTFNISGSDLIRYNRTVRQYTPLVGTSAYVTNKITVQPPPQFIESSEGPRLYRNKSIVRPEQKRLNRGRNKVIVAMSPTEIVNQNIIRNIGLENINAIIGAPTTLYTTFDKSLTVLKNYYQQYYYVDVNTNQFIRILSDLSSVLNQVLEYFIPSRATLLKGIVIEPNILEQVKISPIKSLRVYGKNTRKTTNAAGSLTGSNSDYGATFNLSQTIKRPVQETTGSYLTYNTQLRNTEVTTIQSNYSAYDLQHLSSWQEFRKISRSYVEGTKENVSSSNMPWPKQKIEVYTNNSATASYNTLQSSIEVENNNYSIINASYETYKLQHDINNYSGSNKDLRIDLGLSNVNKIQYTDVNNGTPGAEPYNRLYTRKLFNEEIQTTRLGGLTSMYIPALYEIPPSADFRDFGVYTYFNNRNGIYYFSQIKKTPIYPSVLNATWDFNNQTFGNTITSWSYGAGYNKNDVVYQNISQEDLKTLGLSQELPVDAGNNRYYVFKKQPVYNTTTNIGAFYSGSVPSFTPPSLDNENWDLLRFIPIEVRVPKRVVFDTFTINDPALNNFKTTTISIDKNVSIPGRFIDAFNVSSVAANSYVVGDLALQNIAVLFGMQTNVPGLRIRLYRTKSARDQDINRSYETRPQNSHGILLDAIFSSDGIFEITNPIPMLVAGETPPRGKIFYTIDNLNDSTKLGITLLLYYFAIEIEPRIPFGYLKKHYRFFRDNSTSIKRRNYLGCKNTQETTIDGLPPIQVFISEGKQLQIAPSTGNREIITGGGGTLNVT